MTYTEKQVKIFNEVFNFEHSMTAIAPCQLTTDGKVEEVGRMKLKGILNFEPH